MTTGEDKEVQGYDFFLSAHTYQLKTSVVPENLWPVLHEKLSKQLYDAGSYFSLMQVQDEDGDIVDVKPVVIKEEGLRAYEGVFLVGHAWTFRPETARQHLEQYPGLLERLVSIFDLECGGKSREEQIEEVMDEKWKHAQTYSVGNAETIEERMPWWYIMDEFGSKIKHDDDPNCRLIPFVNLAEGAVYCIFFPIKDIGIHEEITRDYLEGPSATREENRNALKNIFEEVKMTHVNWHQEQPDKEFFKSGRLVESIPEPGTKFEPLPKDRKLRVYSQYHVTSENLSHPRFEIVEGKDEADVLWLRESFKTFKELSESEQPKMISQFPGEGVLTVKDFLCVVCRRNAEEDAGKDKGDGDLVSAPKWLPTTFNLQNELPKFVSYFQQREERGLDNHWIVKPVNLARALDTQVAKSLHHILKQSFSGPKIVQKYLSNPVLFERPETGKVKFDIRYILLLSSSRPLKAYVYDRFWLRFANRPFELKHLDIYEKHFTVMNYNDAHLEQMFCHDFILKFEQQYPNHKWGDVEKDIRRMFRKMFEGAVAKKHPAGIAENPQSRAMYAADLMLEWEKGPNGEDYMQPKLLEVNFMPDCERACDYYPEFFNNVFQTLFLDDPKDQNVTEL